MRDVMDRFGNINTEIVKNIDDQTWNLIQRVLKYMDREIKRENVYVVEEEDGVKVVLEYVFEPVPILPNYFVKLVRVGDIENLK